MTHPVGRAHATRVAPKRKLPRVAASVFEDLYERSEDPWSFATSAYESRKYAHTLSSVGKSRFDRALEVGCSIGVLTQQLASMVGDLFAIDVSERALERARRRLGGAPGVTFACVSFPEELPEGAWDLIVCSEVLYYLDDDLFGVAVDRLRAWLQAGSTVLAVHWRPLTRTYPLLGDEVHDRLVANLGSWHALDDRRPEYRLDRFDGHK